MNWLKKEAADQPLSIKKIVDMLEADYVHKEDNRIEWDDIKEVIHSLVLDRMEDEVIKRLRKKGYNIPGTEHIE